MTACEAEEKVLVFDDYFFTFAETGVAKLWEKFWSDPGHLEMLKSKGFKPYLLNRSDVLVEYFESGEDLWTPPQSYSGIAQDIQTLTMIMDRLGDAPLFLSSYYTFPLGHRSALVCYDLIPEHLHPDDLSPGWFGRRMAPLVASGSAAISENTRKEFVEVYGSLEAAKNMALCYPGVDSKSFFICGGADAACECALQNDWVREIIDDETPYIVQTGGTAAYKNFDLFCKAIRKLDSEFRVVITGMAPNPELVADFASRGREILFVDADETSFGALLRHAACLVYPSTYEGFGLPVAEAIASGSPVVVSVGSSVDEFESDFIHRFDGSDVATLSSIIDRLVDESTQLVASDRDSALDGLASPLGRSWSDFAEDICNFLVEVPDMSGPLLARHELVDTYLQKFASIPS